MPKYPEIHVQLTGANSNAGAIMGAVVDALRKNGIKSEEINEFRMECVSGDYDHLLRTCMEWVDVG